MIREIIPGRKEGSMVSSIKCDRCRHLELVAPGCRPCWRRPKQIDVACHWPGWLALNKCISLARPDSRSRSKGARLRNTRQATHPYLTPPSPHIHAHTTNRFPPSPWACTLDHIRSRRLGAGLAAPLPTKNRTEPNQTPVQKGELRCPGPGSSCLPTFVAIAPAVSLESVAATTNKKETKTNYETNSNTTPYYVYSVWRVIMHQKIVLTSTY